jgi:hypothetical protein
VWIASAAQRDRVFAIELVQQKLCTGTCALVRGDLVTDERYNEQSLHPITAASRSLSNCAPHAPQAQHPEPFGTDDDSAPSPADAQSFREDRHETHVSPYQQCQWRERARDLAKWLPEIAMRQWFVNEM